MEEDVVVFRDNAGYKFLKDKQAEDNALKVNLFKAQQLLTDLEIWGGV